MLCMRSTYAGVIWGLCSTHNVCDYTGNGGKKIRMFKLIFIDYCEFFLQVPSKFHCSNVTMYLISMLTCNVHTWTIYPTDEHYQVAVLMEPVRCWTTPGLHYNHYNIPYAMIICFFRIYNVYKWSSLLLTDYKNVLQLKLKIASSSG